MALAETETRPLPGEAETTDDPSESEPGLETGKGGGHSWMMIACCVPMLVIAIVLVAIGVASVSFIFIAVMCTAMMALMMRAM